MSEMSKAARSAMKDKIKRITAPMKGKVDASDYGPEETDMHAEAKTGLRPISRRQYRSGGMVAGEASGANAGRKPRKNGGSALTADSLINRDVREANEKRDGVKHVGGFKRGGAPKADGGNAGDTVPTARMQFGAASGSHLSRAAGLKTGGRTGKSLGGDLALGAISPVAGIVNALTKDKDKKKRGGSVSDGELEGTRPTGGRMARKSGGRTGRTNVNVIITQPAPAAQDAPPPMPMMPPRPPMAAPMPPAGAGAPPPMGGMGTGVTGGGGPPVPLGRATGGRTSYRQMHGGAGSGLGRLEKIKG